MIDLWTLLVVDLFQSFWIAVFAIAGLMFGIFAVCSVSEATYLNFLFYFLLAMTIGYTGGVISILITILYLILTLRPFISLFNS